MLQDMGGLASDIEVRSSVTKKGRKKDLVREPEEQDDEEELCRLRCASLLTVALRFFQFVFPRSIYAKNYWGV